MFARVIAGFVYHLVPIRRRVVFANLQLCFPEKSSAEIRAIARAHYDSLALGLFETCRAWWADAGALPPHRLVGQEFGDAIGQVAALDPDARELFAAFFAVLGRGIGAHRFLAHVKFLEREDGETVDHHARRLRISRTTGSRGLKGGDDRLVHFLDDIVSLLVEAIDVALGAVDSLEAEVVAPGDVFLVPELKIAEMIFLHEPHETITFGGGWHVVPAGGESGLQVGDVGRGETHGWEGN
jgi:hypothetical protein